MEIKSGLGVREIHLRQSEGLISVAAFVEVGITDRIQSKGNKVCLHYRAPASYSFTERKYDPKQ